MYTKNIKLVCSFIIIGVIFIIAIFYNSRNSADIESISAVENDVANKVGNMVVNENIIDDEITLDNSDINESTDIEETESKTIIKEEQEDSEELNNNEEIAENDLAIEHSPEHVGSFVIINSVGYEKFKFNKYNASVYIESVNKYAENLISDIKIYNLIAPTSSEFNMPGEYKDLSDSQKDGINYAYTNMDNEIITVDAYSNIEAHKDEYLYFKTDHHWTALGAFRAYESFMNIKGEEPIYLDKYNKIDSENKYLGSIYNMTKSERLKNNLDDIWYYNPLLSVEYSSINRDETKWSSKQIIFPSYFDYDRKYAAFMGGDTAFSHIKVDSQSEKKILIIKDSYANAFIPFLLPHYKDIFIVDPRYYKNNVYDLIEDNGINEVLIINYASVLQLPAFSQMLGDMGPVNVTSGTAIKAEWQLLFSITYICEMVCVHAVVLNIQKYHKEGKNNAVKHELYSIIEILWKLSIDDSCIYVLYNVEFKKTYLFYAV